MNQTRKYTWLLDKLRRFGKLSFKEISDKWEDDKEYSDGHQLSRATFNRWIRAIQDQFGLEIECEKGGSYRYYISNPDEIDKDRMKKWMLDSFTVGNLMIDNLSLKDRILVDEIPSARDYLSGLLEAMKANRVVVIYYHPFGHDNGYTFPIEPYCVKLFENRWYVLARNNRDAIRVYGLDRIEDMEITDETFKMPKDFNAQDYFANIYGISVGTTERCQKIIIRANGYHKYYIESLPLHTSQRKIEDCGEYADFEFRLVPTMEFIMRLLHYGGMIEVLKPGDFRKDFKGWVNDMYEIYKNDENKKTEEQEKR